MRLLVTGGSGFIGTNLVEHYGNNGDEIMNLDLNPPKIENHERFWRRVDIRDASRLDRIVSDFKPDYVMHMAARANLTGKTLEDYATNTQGVENLIIACNKLKNLRKAVFASTMLVCEVGYQPRHENDYCPNTLYGESKVLGEKLLRDGETGFDWSIVRPTSIWGPWFGPTYRGFFSLIMKRRYFNFSGKMSVKTYGYIGNVVYQLDSIMRSGASTGRTLYVGDYTPYSIKEWAREIAGELNYTVLTVPRACVWLAAKLGDVLQKKNRAFPMNSFRFRNMTTDNVLDLSETEIIAPGTQYSRIEGNRLTLKWMEAHC
jgi:nucleoside-diphosphate-sugar epimerase